MGEGKEYYEKDYNIIKKQGVQFHMLKVWFLLGSPVL